MSAERSASANALIRAVSDAVSANAATPSSIKFVVTSDMVLYTLAAVTRILAADKAAAAATT